MTKVIVTGASGFIGLNLCKILNEKGIKTYAILRSESSYDERLKSLDNVVPVICDLENIGSLPQIIPETAIDAVYHLAWCAVSGRDRGDYNIQLNNVRSTMDLITAISTMDCHRFIGVGSTAEVDSYNACIRNDISPDIVSLYGVAKMTAHFMSKALCKSYNIEHIWGTIGNTYGVGDKSKNFINLAINLLQSEGEAKFTSGEQNYDFVYVSDVAEALYCLGLDGRDKYSYYIGGGEPQKLKYYIKKLRDIINPQKELQLGAIPYHGVSAPMDTFNIESLKRDTGFVPKVSFEEGIRRTMEWLGESE